VAKPILLQDRFTGMWQDAARDKLPKDKAWDIQDYIPGLGAPLRKRGGWSFSGVALTTLNAGAGNVIRVMVAPFSGGTKVLAVANVSTDARLFDLTDSSDEGAVYAVTTSAFQGMQTVFYNNLLIFAGTGAPANGPRKWSGSGAVAALGGTPPAGELFAVYKNRLLLARDSTSPTRIWFSGAGNPESWDTSLRWLDTSAPVVAIAPLRNSLLVFHSSSVERIRGDIPPGSAAANMVLEPLFDNVGCASADAVAVEGDSVVWADGNGVYQSDGASISDLTKQGGISEYWRTNASIAGTVVSVGLFKGYAFVALYISGGTSLLLVCELRSRCWFRFNNVQSQNFANSPGSVREFYFSNQANKRVGELSTTFAPDQPHTYDAGGAALLQPTLLTGFYTLDSQVEKRIKNVYLSYAMASADDELFPELDVRALYDPAETGSISLGTLPHTSTGDSEVLPARVRKRKRVGKAEYGVGLVIVDDGNIGASDTRLYAIEGELEAQEGSRRR
jgi:hypothetical protein